MDFLFLKKHLKHCKLPCRGSVCSLPAPYSILFWLVFFCSYFCRCWSHICKTMWALEISSCERAVLYVLFRKKKKKKKKKQLALCNVMFTK